MSKQNPFDDPQQQQQMALAFEQAKLAAADQAKRVAAEQAASWGVSQQAQATFGAAQRQLDEIQARQQRLARAGLLGARVSAPDVGADARAESARLDLGRALNQAVDTGLISEQQAVTMIVVGGVNNQPLDPADARAMLVSALAQAVAAGTLDASLAERIAGELAVQAPSQGQVRPPGLPAEAPAATAAAVLEDLVYAALAIEPCHLPEHDEYHRDSSLLCSGQLAQIGYRLLSELAVPLMALPRAPHRDADGRRAACCARDGRIGTWLVYGRTLDPAAAFSRGPAPDPLA